MAKKVPAHFEVHPSVVYQLGESLISDAVQALIELVKNCYDADATFAKVIIDSQSDAVAIDTSKFGRIIVEDDGLGMTMDDIASGWLTISNRKKNELKQRKKTTPGGRTPLGDKGLGRLGVQRLGEELEIFTRSKGESGYRFGFSWLDFATAPKLEDVNIAFEECDYPRKHGTTVIISGLKEPGFWRGQAAIKKLEQELSRMISPYRQIRDFSVFIEVDGKTIELLEISDRIRDVAPVRYRFTFDGKNFVINGRVRLDHFRSSNTKDAEQFALVAESDGGNALFDFLQSQKFSRSIELSHSKNEPWFLEFSGIRIIDDLDKVERINDGNGSIANPGPFVGEVDSFDLGPMAFQNQSVFDKINEFRGYIKSLSGIRVYRDGFAIRVDHDWLKLGAQWTSAGSYYVLKPDNTLGYIALSARDNMALEETTDREGFKDSSYFRNFYMLLEEFKSFTSRVHEFFGRSWIDFCKKRNETLARVDSRKTVEDISRAIKKGLAGAPVYQKDLKVITTRLDDSMSASKEIVARLKSAKLITPELRREMTETLTDLEPLLAQAKDTIDRASNYLSEVSSLRDLGQVLDDRVDGLRRQMDDVYETVALGLTAEALSHEIYNVADQLAKRTKSVQTTLRNKGINEQPVLAFVEYVKSSVLALRKQMSFLSPSLRYVREQRHDIDVFEFVAELVAFYSERLSKNKISIVTLGTESERFAIRMNKGKLTQVVDNLILNSEYWLKEELSQRRITTGIITFELSRPFLRVFDNGSGMAPSIEDSLFEPFMSAKKQGRGLGLFIVKQLLDSEGCNIGLVPERNQKKRLFKFQIDLRGVLHD